MKRAVVWCGYGEGNRWWVTIGTRYHGPTVDISGRVGPVLHQKPFPTHTEALANALAEVGLATPEQHREAP